MLVKAGNIKKLLTGVGILATAAIFSVNDAVTAAAPGNNALVTFNYDNTATRSATSGGYNTSMSKDGRFVAYVTTPADNSFATAVTNAQAVVRNMQTNTLELASASDSGVAGNSTTSYVRLSETGRFLLF